MEAILFDLDNTLFDVKQYFNGAFKDIATYLSSKYVISKKNVYESLLKNWNEKTSMYPYLYNDLLESLKLDQKELPILIKYFNEYDGDIFPYKDTVPTLKDLKGRGYKLGIITDGNSLRQERKIRILKIKDFFDVIIFTKKIAPKPSSEPYFKALEKLNLKGKDTLYVGDNPFIDFQGAKKSGMQTLRILRGEFKNFPKNSFIDYEITDLKEIQELLVK